MSLSTFGRGRNGEIPAPSAPSAVQSANLTAFIDQGSSFEGKLSFKDTVRIDGGFQGEITSENTLIVGETGEVHATIRSAIVVVSGTVTGDIHATTQLVLHKTARVEGDVESPVLVVEEGATLNGSLKMTGSPSAKSAASAATVSVSAVGDLGSDDATRKSDS